MKSLNMAKRPGTTKLEVQDSPIYAPVNRGDNGSSRRNGQMNVDMTVNRVDYEADSSTEEFKTLEDHHIEQMIEELLDYGSIELCSVLQN